MSAPTKAKIPAFYRLALARRWNCAPSDSIRRRIVSFYGKSLDDTVGGPGGLILRKLVRLLRDARQDPQPASPKWDPDYMTPEREAVADRLAAQATPIVVDCQPEQDDTTSDTIDFDALPIGPRLVDRYGEWWFKVDGGWIYVLPSEHTQLDAPPAKYAPYSIVYQPAPLSPGECLRGLLAGRTDADELIDYASKFWPAHFNDREAQALRKVVGDAAREVHGDG